MGIVNKDGYYNLNTFTGNEKLEFFHQSLIHHMRDLNTDEYDFYYLEFKLAHSFDVFPLHTFVPEEIINKIKNKEIFLMVVNFHEGFLSIVEGIYNSLVIRDKIPAEQIILGSGNYDILNEVQRISRETGLPEIRIEWYLELEYTQRERKKIMIGSNPNASPCVRSTLDTLRLKKYDKKYLNFNRRWRLHRPTMVALLKCYGLIDQGYVSLGDSDMSEEWNNYWWYILEEASKHNKVHKLLKKHENEILALPRLYVDTDDLVTNRAWLDNDTDPYYNDTYFSLVSETMYFQERKFDGGRYLTEKIFKSITCEHPFVLVTHPKTLPLLHELGYKTFSPYIDESYDNEMDDYERMLKICDEVKRLCNLKPIQLKKYLIACKEIVNHNVENLMGKKNFVYKMNYK
jgi:hypothetical protein